jgi:acetyltransferase
VIVQSHFADLRTKALGVLREAGVPYQRHVEVAVQCLAAAADRSAALRRLAGSVEAAATAPAAPAAPAEAHALIARARAEGRHLLEPEARELLRAHAIPVPSHRMVASAAEAAAAAAEFPDRLLAMKVVSRDIVHKSEAGGVQLRLRGGEALAGAFTTIRERAQAWRADARLSGCLVTPMAEPGVELIVGVIRDGQHGPVVVAGLGGVFVEQLGDVAFRAPPLSREDARSMLDQLRFRSLLVGARGAAPVYREAIADLIVRVAQVALAHPDIVEIDLNPVIAHGSGYTLVDARMLLEGVD